MDKISDEMLLSVQKPGRYVGGEWNSVRKQWSDRLVKIALAFPDTYEVGSSYLGMKILYGIINGRDDSLCERCFAPWPDFEKVLRDNKLALFGLESRRPLSEYDMVGFSLTYELSYTNALNMLDLGGIPLLSADRKDADPIVMAGGPSCYNPLPMSQFIDAFMIGDGEEVINELIDAYKSSESRSETLERFSNIKGVWVPALNPDRSGVKVAKRIVKDLDSAYYPADQIVPNIPAVHDRLVIEIMRGCKHACAFCQASSVYRPCRERSVERVLDIARRTYANTGYDEISLLSLSSVDHSGIKQMISELNAEFSGKGVSVSVPSLRIDRDIEDLPVLISEVKKSGLTFAPEAGSEGLRKSIGKDIDIEKLFAALDASYKAGWNRVKLYFMIGLPRETREDVLAIADMAARVSRARVKTGSGHAQVTLSINAFIPKPHTVFEREAMDGIEALEAKRSLLKRALEKTRSVKADFHSFEMSFFEAAFSRGDGNLGKVVYEAWSRGARFDGWKECFDAVKWRNAFASAGIDPAFYAYKKWQAEEELPWGFVSLKGVQFDKAAYI